MVSPAYLQK
jgi:hypothetical protein